MGDVLLIFYYLQTRMEKAYGSLNCLRFTADNTERETQIIEKALLDFRDGFSTVLFVLRGEEIKMNVN